MNAPSPHKKIPFIKNCQHTQHIRERSDIIHVIRYVTRHDSQKKCLFITFFSREKERRWAEANLAGNLGGKAEVAAQTLSLPAEDIQCDFSTTRSSRRTAKAGGRRSRHKSDKGRGKKRNLKSTLMPFWAYSKKGFCKLHWLCLEFRQQVFVHSWSRIMQLDPSKRMPRPAPHGVQTTRSPDFISEQFASFGSLYFFWLGSLHYLDFTMG